MVGMPWRIVCVAATLGSAAAFVMGLTGLEGAAWYFRVSVGILGLVFVVLVVRLAPLIHGPVLSLSSTEEFIMRDSAGNDAVWRSRRKLIPLNANVRRMRTVLDADGPEPSVGAQLDGRAVDILKEARRGTETRAEFDFGAALRRYRCHEFVATVTYHKSFTRQNEEFFIRMYHSAVSLELRAHFPPDRKPTEDAVLRIEDRGILRHGPRPVKRTSAETHGPLYVWRGLSAKGGEDYVVQWKW